MKLSSNKRGILAGQVLVLIMSAVIIILLFYFGVKGYDAMRERSMNDDISLFTAQLTADVKTLSSTSTKEYSYAVPKEIAEICVVDNAHASELNKSPLFLKRALLANHVLGGGPDNLFLLTADGEIFFSSSISGLGVSSYPYFYCKQNQYGKFEVTLEGKAKKVLVKNDDTLSLLIDLSSADVMMNTADSAITVYAPKGTPTSLKELSFRRSAPASKEALTDSILFLSTGTFCNDAGLDAIGSHKIPFKQGKKVDGQGLLVRFFLPPSDRCSSTPYSLIFLYEGEFDASGKPVPVMYTGTCAGHMMDFWICDV